MEDAETARQPASYSDILPPLLKSGKHVKPRYDVSSNIGDALWVACVCPHVEVLQVRPPLATTLCRCSVIEPTAAIIFSVLMSRISSWVLVYSLLKYLSSPAHVNSAVDASVQKSRTRVSSRVDFANMRPCDAFREASPVKMTGRITPCFPLGAASSMTTWRCHAVSFLWALALQRSSKRNPWMR